jgi:hypothetical protein
MLVSLFLLLWINLVDPSGEELSPGETGLVIISPMVMVAMVSMVQVNHNMILIISHGSQEVQALGVGLEVGEDQVLQQRPQTIRVKKFTKGR